GARLALNLRFRSSRAQAKAMDGKAAQARQQQDSRCRFRCVSGVNGVREDHEPAGCVAAAVRKQEIHVIRYPGSRRNQLVELVVGSGANTSETQAIRARARTIVKLTGDGTARRGSEIPGNTQQVWTTAGS